MKKHYFFNRHLPVLGLMLMLFGGACSGDGKVPEDETPVITLTTPEDKTSIDLSAVEVVAFTWEAKNVSGNYFVTFRTSGNQASFESFLDVTSPLVVTAAELNERLGRLGVAPEVSTPIYWSVTPYDTDIAAATEPRTIHVTRLPDNTPVVTMLLPANNTFIDLANVEFITFSWEITPAGSEVKALLGQRSDLSDGQSLPIGAAPSPLDLPAAVANELLKSYGGVPGETHILYWTILPATVELQPDTEIRTINVKIY
jgi:hypothetical protein